MASVPVLGACAATARPTPSEPVTPSTTVASTASAEATTPTPSTPSTPSPTPAATFPALDTAFDSPWYGYRVAYPSGWQAAPGSGPWPLHTNLRHNDPHLDVIRGPVSGQDVRFVAASQALPAGTTIEGFRSWASPGTCLAKDPIPTPFVVGGAAALISLNGCASMAELGGLIWDVEVVSGGRGYDFTIDGHLTSAAAAAWLASITLDPTAAPTGSALPTTR